MELKGKNVVITGGASGLGEKLVIDLINEGANVCVLDVQKERLDNLKSINSSIYSDYCDISDNKSVEQSIERYFEKVNSIDILINNAAIIHNSLLINFKNGKFEKYDIDMWNKVINTNLNGVFYITSEVVYKMITKRTKGLIINISSISANGNLGQSAYSAAKAGINALTVTWAKELSFFKIRVAGIAPGFVNTETTLSSMNEKTIDNWKDNILLHRFAEISEIIDGIKFIIKNDFYNGRILEIDGGLRI